ncbi:MAG: alpha/beta hydrolase-fold protein [Anaerolineales bacterium]|nr:alpha/beta hydrolase-fold protein [Anaerolineales bacterium]
MKLLRLLLLTQALLLLNTACAAESQGSPSTATPTARQRPAVTASPVFTLTPLVTSIPGKAAVHTAGPSPTAPSCLARGGEIVQGKLETNLLRDPLEFSIYLPPCYAQSGEQRFPSLYLIHGQSYTHDQWDRLGADETADEMIASGAAPPFLIVMPRDRLWEQPTQDPFGEAVVEALIPYIDSHYRTLPERTFRAIGGLSRGAGWAVHLGLTHWELFGAIGGHSLPVFHTDAAHIRQWLDAIPPDSMPRIYLDIGEKDRPNILRSAVWFEAILTEKSIPHEWHLFRGYHEEAYWSAHLEGYLRWYAEGWVASGVTAAQK